MAAPILDPLPGSPYGATVIWTRRMTVPATSEQALAHGPLSHVCTENASATVRLQANGATSVSQTVVLHAEVVDVG